MKSTLSFQNRRSATLFQQRKALVTDKKTVFKRFSHTLAFGILLTAVILFYVWTRVEVVRLNYAISDVSKKEKELLMKNEQLKVELATLSAPSRLSSLARDELHLKDPNQRQVIYMK